MRFGEKSLLSRVLRRVGRATAERFLSEGANVVISDVYEERLKATAKEIGTPDTLLSVIADVSRKDQVDALIAKAVERFGRLDVMVNNAGICPIVPFLDVTEETYDQVLDVNLKGAFSEPRPLVAR